MACWSEENQLGVPPYTYKEETHMNKGENLSHEISFLQARANRLLLSKQRLKKTLLCIGRIERRLSASTVGPICRHGGMANGSVRSTIDVTVHMSLLFLLVLLFARLLGNSVTIGTLQSELARCVVLIIENTQCTCVREVEF